MKQLSQRWKPTKKMILIFMTLIFFIGGYIWSSALAKPKIDNSATDSSIELSTNVAGFPTGYNGDIVTYKIKFSETGTGTVTDALYNISVSTGITVKSIDACTVKLGQATCPVANPNGTWSMTGVVPSMEGHSAVEFQVRARYNTNYKPSVALIAEIEVGSGQTETNTGNNIANSITNISRRDGLLQTTIERIDGGTGRVDWGQRITYKIIHANTGSGVADGSLMISQFIRDTGISFTGLTIACAAPGGDGPTCPTTNYGGSNDIFGGAYQFGTTAMTTGYDNSSLLTYPGLLPNGQSSLSDGSGIINPPGTNSYYSYPYYYRDASYWWGGTYYYSYGSYNAHTLVYAQNTQDEWPSGSVVQYIVSFIPVAPYPEDRYNQTQTGVLAPPTPCNTPTYTSVSGIPGTRDHYLTLQSTTVATSLNSSNQLDTTSNLINIGSPAIPAIPSTQLPCPEIKIQSSVSTIPTLVWNQPTQVTISHKNIGSIDASGSTVSGTNDFGHPLGEDNGNTISRTYGKYKDVTITCTGSGGVVCPPTPTFPNGTTLTGVQMSYSGIVGNWPPGGELVYTITFTPLGYTALPPFCGASIDTSGINRYDGRRIYNSPSPASGVSYNVTPPQIPGMVTNWFWGGSYMGYIDKYYFNHNAYQSSARALSIPVVTFMPSCLPTDLSTKVTLSDTVYKSVTTYNYYGWPSTQQWLQQTWQLDQPTSFTFDYNNTGSTATGSSFSTQMYLGANNIEYKDLTITCEPSGGANCPSGLQTLSASGVLSGSVSFISGTVGTLQSGGNLKYTITLTPTKDLNPSACDANGTRPDKELFVPGTTIGANGTYNYDYNTANNTDGNWTRSYGTYAGNNYQYQIVLKNTKDLCGAQDVVTTITPSPNAANWKNGDTISYIITHENTGTTTLDNVDIIGASKIYSGNFTPYLSGFTITCTASPGMDCPTDDFPLPVYNYGSYTYTYPPVQSLLKAPFTSLSATGVSDYIPNKDNYNFNHYFTKLQYHYDYHWYSTDYDSYYYQFYGKRIAHFPPGGKISYMISFTPIRPTSFGPSFGTSVFSVSSSSDIRAGTFPPYTGNEYDRTPGNNIAQVYGSIVNTASDLSIPMSIEPNYPKPGAQVVVKIQLKDNQGTYSRDSNLNISLPSIFTPDISIPDSNMDCKSSGGSICLATGSLVYDQTGRTISGIIPLLQADGGQLTMTLTGTISTSAKPSDIGTIYGWIQNDARNDFEVFTGSNYAVNSFNVRRGDEDISKSVTSHSITPGGTIEYTILVHGDQGIALGNPSVSDTLQPGSAYQTGTVSFNGAPDGTRITGGPTDYQTTPLLWSFDQVKPNEDITIKYTVKNTLPCGSPTINNSASFSYHGITMASDGPQDAGADTLMYDGVNQHDEDVSVDCFSHIVITPSWDHTTSTGGDMITGSIKVENISAFDATTPITITGSIDKPAYLSGGSISFPGCSDLSGGKFICTIPPLAAHTSAIFTAIGQLSYSANGPLTLDTSDHTGNTPSLTVDCGGSGCTAATNVASTQTVLVVGNILGGQNIGMTNLMGSYIQQPTVGSIFADTINRIRKNLALNTRGAIDTTNIPLLEYTDMPCTVHTGYFTCNNSSPGYLSEFDTKRTIVVQGKDIILSGSTIGTGTSDPRAIIALKDKNGLGGHIYIDGSVQRIYASLIAEDGISGTGGTSTKQLYIRGTVIAKDLLCSPISASCPNDISQLRTGVSELANPLWTTNPPIPAYQTASVIIEYDSRMLLNPPPLFAQ